MLLGIKNGLFYFYVMKKKGYIDYVNSQTY